MHLNILRTATVAATALASLATPAFALEPEKPRVCSLARRAMTGAVLSVPFRVVDGRIYVTAKVDGKGPFRIGAATLSDVEVRVSDRYPELLAGHTPCNMSRC
jgi:hypothetical protein